jgi:hypothetical protein
MIAVVHARGRPVFHAETLSRLFQFCDRKIQAIWKRSAPVLVPFLDAIYSPSSIICLAAYTWVPIFDVAARRVLWNELVFESSISMPEWLRCLPALMSSFELISQTLNLFNTSGEDILNYDMEAYTRRAFLVGYTCANALLVSCILMRMEGRLHFFSLRS